MVKTKTEQLVLDELEKLAPEHGIDIVDVEVVGATKAPCVRVRIEKADGESVNLNLDEVAAESGWISDVLDELDPISSSYTLEVSSAGVFRPLRRVADFARFVGEECEVVTLATEGRKKFTGTIARTEDDAVVLGVDGEELTFALDDLKKATLKPALSFKSAQKGE